MHAYTHIYILIHAHMYMDTPYMHKHVYSQSSITPKCMPTLKRHSKWH